MAVSYQDIRIKRQWKAATGVSKQQFNYLSQIFGAAYKDLFGETLAERRASSTQEATFATYADLLFFGLYSIKSGLTYDLMGLSFGLSSSNAHANQATVLSVLQAALEQGGWMPRREYATDEEFIEDWREESAIVVDATEHRRQRPGNQQDQQHTYSGKKSSQLKMMGLSTIDRRIKYLSYCYEGSTHDFTLLKEELPPDDEAQWFQYNKVHVDLGYQGIAKQYGCAKLYIPMKKPRGGELTKKQKKKNRKKSRKRIVVENAIGGMKRYRFLSDRARGHSIRLYNKIAGIAAGLWNYNVVTN